jgi:hypothetical protein
MSIENKQLFILPFPQHIRLNQADGSNTLVSNVVILPRNNPFDNLVAGDDQTAFVKASFKLKAWLVKGESDDLPVLGDHAANANYQQKNNLVFQNNNRENIFTTLANEFEIVANPADPDAPSSLSSKQPVLLKKYLPEAYRNAFSFGKPTNSNAVTDDSYFCSLKNNDFVKPYVRNNKVNWAQVLAFALQQPLLAKALGILYTDIEIPLDDADFFKEGGWIYFDFDDTVLANTTLNLTDSNDVQYYAARIPATITSRQVFTPVLFPVLQIIDAFGTTEATVPFDDVFKEAVIYDDGFAKIVHCSQAINSNPILEIKEGPAPLMDTGIRLGWDDEQILTWMGRSFADTHLPQASQKAHSKLAISRYRIDVAEISKQAYDSDDISITENEANGNWRSQVAINSIEDLKIGDIDLGAYQGESGVQVSPVRSNEIENRLWLPAFFSFWNGASLAVPDLIPDEINNVTKYKAAEVAKNADKNAPLLYKQTAGTEVSLKYGKHYAFRVRLSDISGGGPVANDKALIPGENGICKHKFTRNVAPSPPIVSDEDNGLKIIRPRLGYPAILFAADNTNQAIQLLKQDRIALDTASANLAAIDPITGKYNVQDPGNPATFDLFKNASREVSVADPDVDKVHVIVEVETLDMDREGSYNALHRITPKEPYLLLYETFRSFDNYSLSLDENLHTINLTFEYRNVPVIFFNEGKDPDALGLGNDLSVENGPLILPTARKIRITIRSFCSADNTDYFGDEDFRFSTPVKRDVNKSIENLEAAPLLEITTDPLLSIFFRPEPSKTSQESRAAATRGEQNQTDVNIIERLSAIADFTKNGLSIMGKENVRVQFGCSNLIGHTLSPDHSSLTFATIDDLARKWISVIKIDLNRDWSWDMLEPDSFEVFRQWKYQRDDGINFDDGDEERVGVIGLTKGLNWQNMPDPDRLKTRLVFIDALDAKPGAKPKGAQQEPTKFPEPIDLRYRISPRFNKAINFDATAYDYTTQPYSLETTLPIKDPPSQVPEIVSVGLALSTPDSDEQLFSNKYSATSEQIKYLWLEFAEPVENPDDAYFVRLLAYAPDPAIADYDIDVQKEMDEPAINLDPEVIRIIRPLQVKDKGGHDSMQALAGATADVDPEGKGIRHFLLPLPQGLNADSPELFGFFTYEFRVGHTKWSLAQAFPGRPLRVTGVQHPAPRLRLSAFRKPETIEVAAMFAQSFFKGSDCTPLFPRTNIYALLYAQVIQADRKQYRNILIDQVSLRKPARNNNGEKPIGLTSWALKDIRTKLRQKGMDINAPLSVLAIELMPDGRHFANDRIDVEVNNLIDLENIRILRTSRLYKITDSCPV